MTREISVKSRAMSLSARSSWGELRRAALRSRFGPTYFAQWSTENLSHTQTEAYDTEWLKLWLMIMMIITKGVFWPLYSTLRLKNGGLLQTRDLWIVLFIQKCYYNQCCPKITVFICWIWPLLQSSFSRFICRQHSPLPSSCRSWHDLAVTGNLASLGVTRILLSAL